MAQNKFLSFLNSLDKGASDRYSITEFLANVLTPGDEMEYVNGELMTTGGKPVENIGDKTYYGTLGQANFAGNDPIKDGLLSKMTEAPDKVARKLGLLETSPPPLRPDLSPSSDISAFSNLLPYEDMLQLQDMAMPNKQGFVKYLTDMYNRDPQNYSYSMSQPDGLASLARAFNTISMAESFLDPSEKSYSPGAIVDFPENLEKYIENNTLTGPNVQPYDGPGAVIELPEYMKKKMGLL